MKHTISETLSFFENIITRLLIAMYLLKERKKERKKEILITSHNYWSSIVKE